jgi:hypothetical protein
MPQLGSPMPSGLNTSVLQQATVPLSPTALVEIQQLTGNQRRQKVSAGDLLSGGIAVGLAAVGTNRGNSLALTKRTNIVATAASAAVGVTLLSAASLGIGGFVDVYNDGPSNAFHVYAAGSDTIDTIAGATGVVLTNAFWSRYLVTATGAFTSYRYPIVRSE